MFFCQWKQSIIFEFDLKMGINVSMNIIIHKSLNFAFKKFHFIAIFESKFGFILNTFLMTVKIDVNKLWLAIKQFRKYSLARLFSVSLDQVDKSFQGAWFRSQRSLNNWFLFFFLPQIPKSHTKTDWKTKLLEKSGK